jgi:hypothetical protein
MPKMKVRVQFTESALEEFKAIQKHENYFVSQWGVKYLKGLVDLPPGSWLDVRRHWDKGLFKISDFVPFDIQGKVDWGLAPSAIQVSITRFKLKNIVSGPGWKKSKEGRF